MNNLKKYNNSYLEKKIASGSEQKAKRVMIGSYETLITSWTLYYAELI